MAGQSDESPKRDITWHKEVENLLTSLTGVISARVVGRGERGIDEVHLLTTVEVAPKQTVRNVESALFARFDVAVDHRKVSVAQTTAGSKPLPSQPMPSAPDAPAPPISARSASGEPPRFVDRERERDRAPQAPPAIPPGPRPVPTPEPAPTPTIVRQLEPTPAADARILFIGHSIESLRTQRLRMKVALEWQGRRLVGEASGADLLRSRLEGFATATLSAVEAALDPTLPKSERENLALSLDGVQIVEAFDRQFVLVAVNALLGRKITLLTGAAPVDDSQDRAVILATLQATDRRVRAFLQGFETFPATSSDADESDNVDPFEVWA